VIERAQQVGDRLDLPTRKTGNHREEPAVRPEMARDEVMCGTFTLPGLEAEFVEVIGG
jgi:hypothetical protein